jgi:hypothetical protein
MSLTLSKDAANVDAAYAAGTAWYAAVRPIWESDPSNPDVPMPAHVEELEAAYEAAAARCSKAGKTVLAAYLDDQPLPGDIETRLANGERFSTEEMLAAVEKATIKAFVLDEANTNVYDFLCTKNTIHSDGSLKDGAVTRLLTTTDVELRAAGLKPAAIARLVELGLLPNE